MHINLIAVGTKMPRWVEEAYADYAKRLPPECRLNLIEIPAEKRGKNADTTRILELEAHHLIASIPKNNYCVALDTQGKAISTEQLSAKLNDFFQLGQDISILIGGPEGFAASVFEHTRERWSLSAMTLPHPIVRVIIAEQLYRAWTILKNHPYHK